MHLGRRLEVREGYLAQLRKADQCVRLLAGGHSKAGSIWGHQRTQHLGGNNRIPLVTETVPQATNKYLQTCLVGLALLLKVKYRSSLKKFVPRTDFRYGHFAYEWVAKN